MEMKKVFKVIILIIILLLLITVIHLLRNYFIIRKLQNKLTETTLSKNYQIKQTIEQPLSYVVLNMFQTEKQGKLVEHRVSLENFEVLENITIFNDNSVTTYNKLNDEKTINYNSTTRQLKIINPYNLYTSDSDSSLIIELFKTKISTIEYNNKKCFCISNSMTHDMYIDKETGLVLRTLNGNVTSSNGDNIEIENKYMYVFDKVTNEDVLEPNINDYQ